MLFDMAICFLRIDRRSISPRRTTALLAPRECSGLRITSQFASYERLFITPVSYLLHAILALTLEAVLPCRMLRFTITTGPRYFIVVRHGVLHPSSRPCDQAQE